MTETPRDFVYSLHAEQRARERYGISATPAEWLQAFLDITGVLAADGPPRAILLQNEDGHSTTERWAVRLGQHPVIAIYSPADARIITVVPLKRDLAKRNAIPHRDGWRRESRKDRYRPDWAAEAADA